jgi:hypothetical protein
MALGPEGWAKLPDPFGEWEVVEDTDDQRQEELTANAN